MRALSKLHIFVLFLLVIPEGLNAQNYADSTIVYLQWEKDPLSTMVINWIDTSAVNSAKIQYRRRGTDSWISATADSIPVPDTNVYRYKFEATDLQSGTYYEFNLLRDDEIQFFRTMPEDLSGGINFFVTGDVYGDGTDPSFDTNAFKLISRYSTSYYPFFAVLAGDLVHLNTSNEYNANTINRIFKFLSEWTKNMKTPNDLHIPIVSAYGNHELPQRFGGSPEDAIYFNALFSFPGLRGYERLDFSEYLSLIVLNTDHTARIEGAQTAWLEEQLQATQDYKNVFPVYHVSGYPGFRDPLPGRGLEVKEYWSPLFDQYNVSFAFEHDRHEYKRTVPITGDAPDECGVRYVGGGGYAIITGGLDLGKWYIEKFSDQRHFVRVELTNNKRIIQTIAFNGIEIDYYEESSVLSPPPLLASSSIGSAEFTLNWQSVCDAAGYILDISTDSNFSSFVPGYDGRSVGTVNRLTVTGLNPLTRYYYRIRSVNSTGQFSNYSPSQTVTTTSIPPVARAATQISSDGFTANWDQVNGATNYEIDVSRFINFSSFVGQYDSYELGNQSDVQITGLTSATPYYYRVRAKNSTINLESGNSNIIGVITLPLAPTEFEIVSRSSFDFVITWEESPSTDQYLIDVAEDVNFDNILARYNGITSVSNQLTVEGLQPLNIYYVRVRSRNLEYNVTSVFSSPTAVSTTGIPPRAVDATNVTRNSFTAYWEAAPSADAYLLDVSTDELFTEIVPGFDNLNVGSVLAYEVTGLLSGVQYHYRVRALNSRLSLTSEVSNVINVFTTPETPISLAPTEILPKSFRANWQLTPRVEYYHVDVSNSSTFNSLLEDWSNRLVMSDTSIVVDDLSPNTEYFYRVRASSGDQTVFSEYSESKSVITILEAVSGIEISTITSNSFFASWYATENAQEYIVDVSLDPDFNNLVSGFDGLNVGNSTQVNVDNLSSVTRFYFRVKAIARDGLIEGAYSSVVEITTLPETPQLFEANDVKAVGFTLSWGEVENITSYQIEISLDVNFNQIYKNYVTFDIGNVTDYTLRGITPGTTLYYRVRAKNNIVNLTSDWSNVLSVTTVAIDPQLSTIEVLKTEVLADGQDNSLIKVTLRSDDSILLDEVEVLLTALSGDSVIETINSVTGLDGVAAFQVTNLKAEFVTYVATAIETELSDQPEIAFTPVAPNAISASEVLASSFVANWQPVSGATTYRVDVSPNASFSSYVSGFDNLEIEEGTQLMVTGLFPGDEYFYRVRAVAPTGTSQNSNVINLVTIQADPTLTGVQIEEENILADGATSGVVIVTVRGTNGQPMFGVPVRLETNDTNSTILTVNGLSDENGQTEFEITSDYAGKVEYSVFAGRIEISTKLEINFVPLAPVANQATLLGAVEFTSKWNKVNGATHYLIDLSLDSNFDESFVSPYEGLNVGDIDEFLVDGLAPGTTYYFRVRGATPTASSENSNTISVTTYQIDLVNSTVVPSAQKILANGEQKSNVEIKLINEEGDPLSNVKVELIPNLSTYSIETIQDITNEEGIALFDISSTVAGEGVFTVSAGGLELESKIELIFLFADGEIKLGYNFPNPFGVTTRIPVTIPEHMNVTIDVYNSFGQRIAELENKEFLAGYYEIPFVPRGLASGVYIVRMIADGKVLTQKMMFVK